MAFDPTLVVPFDQEYETPPLACKLILVVVQFKTVTPVVFEIFTVGAVVFCVIVILAVAVQPFAPVAVTV